MSPTKESMERAKRCIFNITKDTEHPTRNGCYIGSEALAAEFDAVREERDSEWVKAVEKVRGRVDGGGGWQSACDEILREIWG